MYKARKELASMLVCVAIAIIFSNANAAGLAYSDQNNWAYYGNGSSDALDVDVFFVCPTVFLGNSTQFNMPIDDADVRKNFIGAINMEKGIYDLKGNFYAPYYRQAGINTYKLEPVAAAPYFELAYQDVKAAFEYYLKEQKQDRPLVLAGFSQGADMIVRLMKDMYHDQRLQEQLVAAYVIGWRVTPEELVQYPHLKMAQGEDDTGVIISFNTEAPNVKTSILVPCKTLGINPLNWKTTIQPAGKSLNKGAVFTGYDGKINKEIPRLTGAYLDKTRGTLKVTDITAEEYPPVLDLFEKGVYHIYDYQFFYRNLQENVKTRIEAFKDRRVIRRAS
ncbi:hypothetical protein SOV_50370 [Sporomusa ovata DSM 2662]|uniref:DUF3089 domain-containing protein n=1 Tax=Sporomusa ovata TaxID=2378 RepID=A0A0U1L2V7_9FIRM|nr:DUF3089 domain-containing protein [Sporomusa ovata]EQB27410.1 hypothetical protein SOV_2c03060 [Sporomusa ovata DSM 2662]CQR73254.1 hypothetical protein SpAn4DRAFT_2486 [Sporomusa ovata]